MKIQSFVIHALAYQSLFLHRCRVFTRRMLEDYPFQNISVASRLRRGTETVWRDWMQSAPPLYDWTFFDGQEKLQFHPHLSCDDSLIEALLHEGILLASLSCEYQKDILWDNSLYSKDTIHEMVPCLIQRILLRRSMWLSPCSRRYAFYFLDLSKNDQKDKGVLLSGPDTQSEAGDLPTSERCQGYIPCQNRQAFESDHTRGG